MKLKTYARKIRAKLKWTVLVPLLSIGGAAFAILASAPSVLTNNAITTASANLLLSTDGTIYGVSFPGYGFNNVVPGGAAVPTAGNPVYLKNTGGVPLGARIALAHAPTNPDNINLEKVNLIVTSVGSGLPPQTYNFQSLVNASNGGLAITGSSLEPGASQQYKLQISMTADAINGSNATMSGVDIMFMGLSGSST